MSIPPEPGHWYYGYTCPRCKQFFALYPDRAEGQGPPKKISGPVATQEQCPHCCCRSLFWRKDLERRAPTLASGMDRL